VRARCLALGLKLVKSTSSSSHKSRDRFLFAHGHARFQPPASQRRQLPVFRQINILSERVLDRSCSTRTTTSSCWSLRPQSVSSSLNGAAALQLGLGPMVLAMPDASQPKDTQQCLLARGAVAAVEVQVAVHGCVPHRGQEGPPSRAHEASLQSCGAAGRLQGLILLHRWLRNRRLAHIIIATVLEMLSALPGLAPHPRRGEGGVVQLDSSSQGLVLVA
jgi:hypothetical protein